MIYDAMREIEADVKVFRLKLGKALNYEYYEDSQTGVFQRRDPREGNNFLNFFGSRIVISGWLKRRRGSRHRERYDS